MIDIKKILILAAAITFSLNVASAQSTNQAPNPTNGSAGTSTSPAPTPIQNDQINSPAPGTNDPMQGTGQNRSKSNSMHRDSTRMDHSGYNNAGRTNDTGTHPKSNTGKTGNKKDGSGTGSGQGDLKNSRSTGMPGDSLK